MSQQVPQTFLAISQFNQLIPSKRALYDMLADTTGKWALYLPDYESKAVTAEYLLQLVRKEVFSIKFEKLRPGKLLKDAKKWEIIDEI